MDKLKRLIQVAEGFEKDIVMLQENLVAKQDRFKELLKEIAEEEEKAKPSFKVGQLYTRQKDDGTYYVATYTLIDWNGKIRLLNLDSQDFFTNLLSSAKYRGNDMKAYSIPWKAMQEITRGFARQFKPLNTYNPETHQTICIEDYNKVQEWLAHHKPSNSGFGW